MSPVWNVLIVGWCFVIKIGNKHMIDIQSRFSNDIAISNENKIIFFPAGCTIDWGWLDNVDSLSDIFLVGYYYIYIWNLFSTVDKLK